MVNEDQVIQLIRAESVLLDRGAIGDLYETALKFVGIGLGGIMYTAGKKGGARGARLIAERAGYRGDDLLQAALIAFNQSNWGQATLERSAEQLQIRVTNSALAGSVSGQRKPICHPIAGYIAGFLEEAWQRPVKVRETECIANGHAHCLFVVE